MHLLRKSRSAIKVASLLLTGLLVGCVSTGVSDAPKAPKPTAAQEEAVAAIMEFFERATQEQLEESPEYLTYIGDKKFYNRLDDYTKESSERGVALAKAQLADLNTHDRSLLPEREARWADLYEEVLQRTIRGQQWYHYGYPVNQMFGVHTQLPSLMIGRHYVTSATDAEAYVARIVEFERVLAEVSDGLMERAAKGIVLPKFLFPKILRSISNLTRGKPFALGEGDTAIYADFKRKVEKLDISEGERENLISMLEDALRGPYYRGYIKLAQTLAALEASADERAGVWRFANGADFYKYRLKAQTDTDLTADQIHQIGLDELSRIHEEMRTIMRNLTVDGVKVGFSGSLQDFFNHLRSSEEFYFPQSEEGRQEYLKRAVSAIDEMRLELPKMFKTFPKAELEVRPVEAYRENAAGTAFYNRPPLTGDKPGIYYVNLAKMANMPIYQLEALAYHEGLPGHHMQLAISQELPNQPRFRQLGWPSSTAYTEGWGLYSEWLPKEFGAYSDHYSDFGRLAMEAWRAARLVVDTGLHHKKWTREQAVQFLFNNTADTEEECRRAIDRYIVMPGQATAYKIGMLRIQELRRKAERELGDKFNLPEFHDAVLRQGIITLTLLDKEIDAYIERTKKRG